MPGPTRRTRNVPAREPPLVALRDDLIGTARRCRGHAEALAHCRAELCALIVEADELGVPVARIAKLTGLTRKSVYAAVRREGQGAVGAA
jgi:hypothetical protein